MYTKLKHILTAGCLSITLATGCSHQYKPIYVKLPPAPEAMEVEVNKNCICGDSLGAVLNNWLELQAYIEQLKAVGCFKK